MADSDCRSCRGHKTKGGRIHPWHDQKLRTAIEEATGGLEGLRDIVERLLGRPNVMSRSEQGLAQKNG